MLQNVRRRGSAGPRRGRLAWVLVLALASCLAFAGPVSADTPPDGADPCAAAGGLDSCHTAAVGQYATYSYGTRWFGSYRGAVPKLSANGYCIDLGYWYPGRSYGYEQRSAAGLHNRLGGAVSDSDLHRMAYALWEFGRSDSVDQASATMLYVHSLMGDAQPGEISPSILGAGVAGVFQRISAQSAEYAGPYTVQAQMPSSASVGAQVTARLTLHAASGAVVAGVHWTVSVPGTSSQPTSSASADGTDTVTFTAARSGRYTLHARAVGVPSNLPTLYVPTTGASADSGQRLVFGASQTVDGGATTTVSRARLTLSTHAQPATVTLGGENVDSVTLSGAPTGVMSKVTLAAYGPAPSAAAVACTGTPAFTSTFTAADGTTKAPAFTPTAAGDYGYRLTIAPTARTTGVTTPCGGDAESFAVYAQPTVHTVVSSATVAAGSTLSDTVAVAGLGDQPATVTASLYGPYASPNALTCTGTPFWTGTVPVQTDGQYQTAPVTLTVSGYYVYVESIAAAGFVRAVAPVCNQASETTLVPGAPTVATRVSAATATPGATISDTAVVSGLGVLPATVAVQLYGPYPSRAAIDCTGKPAATTMITANGDGTYTSPKVTVPQAGYYTFHESIAATSAYPAVITPCASATETTFAQGSPQLSTQASQAIVRPGASLTDHVKVSGLGATPATIGVALYGPYASLAQVDCSGQPAAVRSLKVNGDGSYVSPSVTVSKVGFYVFRESIENSKLVTGVTTSCADTAETTLGAPAIITGGRGPFPHVGRQASSATASATPTRVQIPDLGIDAPIDPITIDLADGELGVPVDIHRTGWWRDGAAPGSSQGTVLIAGHVDSAAAGAGAFYPLPTARPGMLITLTTQNGTTVRYRVTGVRRVLKANLPTSVFDRSGPPRLDLVTCGGPFDAATGHYLDNIIVEARPV
jgi:sortase (surface protein transpeptidase)